MSSIIAQFFSNAWFVRLWVLQEAALAKKTTMTVGAEECDLSVLIGLASHIDRLIDLFNPQDEHFGEAMKGLVCMHQPIRLGRRHFDDYYGSEFLRNVINGPSPFESMVLACRRRVCQDPRDHVFGLVGLARQLGMESQRVDYSLSIPDVFRIFVETALTRRPNALMLFEAGLDNHKSTELPSWVPDFSKAHEQEIFSAQFYFAGGTDVQKDIFTGSFTFADGNMKFSGFEFDIVEEYHYCEFSNELVLASLQNYPPDPLPKKYGLIAERPLENRRCDSDPYSSCSGNLEACWRTLVGNVRKRSFSEPSGVVLEDLTEYDESKYYNMMMDREPCPDPNDEEDMSAFTAYLFSLVIANRSLFVTKRGYFGIGSHRIITGDVIVVAPGLGMPLAMRK